MNLDFKIVYDEKNRLFTIPYSQENLFKTAKKFLIKKCWYENSHYLIPPFLNDEITSQAEKVPITTLDKYAKQEVGQ